MDASEVTAEVVSPMPPLLNYRLPATSGRDLSRWINEFVAGLCRSEPTRLFGLGTVPLQDPDLAAAELAEVAGLGLAGVEIGSNIEGVCIGDDRLADFFAEAERLGLAIFVHALNPATAARLPAAANATFGFAAEISVAAASFAASGTAARCPALRLAFSHGAGGFPLMLTRAQYFWGRTWNEETPAGPGDGAGGDRPDGPSPSELARRFYYDTLVFDRRALTYLIDMLGSGRLLIGSDFPAMPREEPAGRTLRSMGLPPEVLADITWNNCLRFLGIESADALPG
jgi:aminocarboxymuconate-semialdehyde decarboxylase